MRIPEPAQALIDIELNNLAHSSAYTVPPGCRTEIYAALGPSHFSDRLMDGEAHDDGELPVLSAADRIRACLELITAKKAAALWRQACLETDANFSEARDPAEIRREEEEYLARRKQVPIEQISVYDVPRAFVPSHILEMTERALIGQIHDHRAFRNEANEWWQIYGRPELMEREFFIKWAVQDALYEAIGFPRDDREPPAQNALYAIAGVFEGDDDENRTCRFDESRRHQFWKWWLSSAIPRAVIEAGKEQA